MARFFFAAALTLLVPTAPAYAQIYKWVDEKGVANYSNEAPRNRHSTVLDPKTTRVSVYTPIEEAASRTDALAGVNERALSEKIDRLERKLDAERYARESLASAQTRVRADRYAQCLRDRRLDCDYGGPDPYYAPYTPVIIVVNPSRLRSHPIGIPHFPHESPVSRAGLPRPM